MRVIVTGGAGFIGTNLIKRLVNENHCVTSIDNYHTGTRDNHVDQVTYLDMDIRNINDYSWLEPDVIFHLAAIARIQPSFEKPKEYFSTNANGTLNIIDYCSKNNIPLVYAGSSSHHNGKFKNPYTFSKDIGEEIIQLYQTHYNLKACIVRFYNVYGPHQLTEGGYTTLIGKWLNNIEKGIECEIYGDGEQRRDFTHIEDIVDGLYKIGMNSETHSDAWELGTGINYSINEVYDLFKNKFGVEKIHIPDQHGIYRKTLRENDDTLIRLNWKPKDRLKDYIQSL
jgi:UDP-glucose 4-epimerase